MYYPKSQIVTDLYTSGGEFTPFNSKNDYEGYYFKTSDGEFFTGRNPEDKPNTPLVALAPSVNEVSSITSNLKDNKISFIELKDSEPVSSNMYIIDVDYYKAKNLELDRGDAPRPPIQSITIPTDKDYENGEFERFFVKKGNENKFIEISRSEYKLFSEKNESVQFNLYIPISIVWDLTGKEEEVYLGNKGIVSLTERREHLIGFTQSFKGKFSKYWRGK